MRYIVVGCGITGATIARNIAERGKKVEVWDRRNHVAGNMYDHSDEYGIMVHEYGPHIFLKKCGTTSIGLRNGNHSN